MKNRIEKLRNQFDALGVDGVYLTSRTSHRYFTKFDNEDGSLLITRRNAYAFEDFRYIEVASELLSSSYTVVEPKGKRSAWLEEILKSEGVLSLGFEDESLSVSAVRLTEKRVNGRSLVRIPLKRSSEMTFDDNLDA